ncbi:MAG TPA: SGNH/GDSL hydrolase family protein, partial [Anaerolineales bacterium]|nr:SGNH/GDSL hydrolase family protein [Anaerolineales bacterium]
LPRQWRTWPIAPTLNPNMIPVFLDGQAQGKNPYAFTTLGDCQSEPPVFLGIYSTDRYYLGAGYEYLQETIDFFARSDSFGRQSYCTQNGLSVASALSPAWADPDACETGETPLACEIRIYQPGLMFINLGTNWSANATASHEAYLRQIVDILLAEGIIPILSTKGDNVEGDWSINQSIAQVAYDYDVPLWNFWAAIQHLPQHGLDPERPGGNYLIIEAWDRRSFTGLQVLDLIRQTLQPYYPEN